VAALSHDFPKEATSFIERAANSKIEQLFIGEIVFIKQVDMLP
jgi:hypothetical protein